MKGLVTIANGLNKWRDFPIFFLRLVVAWGFLGPFLIKVGNMDAFAQFLAGMDYPIPLASAWAAMIIEGLGIICLTLGFATRLITLPLMFMMALAIITVHWSHGFAAGDNGFQIPLTYFAALLTILTIGPGKISLDGLFARNAR